MKMKGRKAICFISNTTILISMYFITLFTKENDISVQVIAGLIVSTIVFIGGNTYDKWINSKKNFIGSSNEENNSGL